MAKVARFGMTWTVCGKQSIKLPNDIDTNDKEAVKDYILSQWSDIALPDGDYVPDSDTLDNLVDIEVYDDKTT